MTDLHQGCTRQHREITSYEVPFSCPQPDQRLWDAHPRVYLPIEVTGREECPYCGTIYTLKDFVPRVE